MANSGNDGGGGNITIDAEQNILIAGKDGEGTPSVIVGGTIGRGPGGNVILTSPSIELRDGGVTVQSFGTGNAGDINIQASDRLVSHNAAIDAEAIKADGGNIELTVGDVIELKNSSISSSVGQGSTGGNIMIDPQFVILDSSDIVARAGAGGTGGNIDIVSDFIFRSPDSQIDASAGPAGINGTVDIDSPDTNISGSIAVLPETYINAADQLSERCTARTANLNSFVVKGRGGVPLRPNDAAPASSWDEGLYQGGFHDPPSSKHKGLFDESIIGGTARRNCSL